MSDGSKVTRDINQTKYSICVGFEMRAQSNNVGANVLLLPLHIHLTN